MDMDLRKEFREILDESGHYVLLQRTSRKLRCVCWDEKMQESSIEKYMKSMKLLNTNHKECPKCLGAGWISRIERVLTRRQLASDIISMTSRLQTLEIGQQTFDNKLFFFEHNIQPREGDYILEVGWDGTKPTHLINSYLIQISNDLRQRQGRIEFWQTVTKEDNIGTGIKGFGVKNIGPVQNYEIIR